MQLSGSKIVAMQMTEEDEASEILDSEHATVYPRVKVAHSSHLLAIPLPLFTVPLTIFHHRVGRMEVHTNVV